MRSRWLLRQALAYSGGLPREADGVTVWPAGLTGSITHKNGHVAVAAAESGNLQSLGIDVESMGKMKPEFESRLCLPAESALLDHACATTSSSRQEWLTIMFSFKESIFKCLYPLGRVMFYFLDAELVSIEAPGPDGTGALTAKLRRNVGPRSCDGDLVTGRYTWRDGDADRLAFSSCWLPTVV